MKHPKRRTTAAPANDNIRIGGTAENIVSENHGSHVYVRDEAGDVTSILPKSVARKVWTAPIIVTNLPERLPILPEEIALIRGFMSDLVSRILANDNEPD